MSEARVSVLIVDDSPAYRSVLRDVLAEDPRIDLIGQASNGRLALPRIRFHRPNVVILDQEMPEMDGISTLKEIRAQWPEVNVVMFSSRTERGAAITIRALELGAADFLAKPRPGVVDLPGYLRSHLLPRVLAFAPRAKETVTASPRNKLQGEFHAVVVGVSTGGPPALKTMLSGLRPGLTAPILIVQHMPPIFTAQLARTLGESSAVPVREAENGDSIEAGHVYIAPGGRHMEVNPAGSRLRITDAPPELSCRPSANVLFRSAAQAYGQALLGIIMTGMGEDGYLGALELKAGGGKLMAQSEESCLIFGMPARPIREGLADEVLDPSEISRRLNHLLSGVTV